MPEDTVTICRQLTATNLRRSDLERFRSRQKEWSSGWLVASAFTRNLLGATDSTQPMKLESGAGFHAPVSGQRDYCWRENWKIASHP